MHYNNITITLQYCKTKHNLIMTKTDLQFANRQEYFFQATKSNLRNQNWKNFVPKHGGLTLRKKCAISKYQTSSSFILESFK